MMYHKDNGGSALGIGLMMGALGFLAGLLLAPKSGRETREQLGGKSNELKERARGAAMEFKNSARSAAAKVQDTAQDIKSLGDSTKDDMKDVADHAKIVADRAKNETKRTVRKATEQ